MDLLTPEQINATRQSLKSGRWVEAARIGAAPLLASLYRARKRLVRRRVRTSSLHGLPASAPVLSAQILPLFAPLIGDLRHCAGVDQLFSDVDRQINGEFRLAGGSYKSISCCDVDDLPEVEDRHAFHRLYWMARYARAAAFGHSGAASALGGSWTKWLQRMPGPAAFAPYTTAERIASLSECLFWMDHFVRDVNFFEIISIRRQIWSDAQALSANIECGLGVHNHLLNDARGLFRASRVLADIAEADEWREQAFSLWDKFFPQLILTDGTFAEQSSHYHLLLSRTGLEYILAARLFRRALSAETEEKLSKMFELANDLLRPDGSLPRFGDNSPDHTIEDLWGLMAAAHHSGILKSAPRHQAVTPLTYLYCGERPRLPERKSVSHDAIYGRGGFVFLRSADEDTELTVHGDPRPEVHAHGDAGRGSFELWWRGQVIVREPGSILSSSNPVSAWSRSGKAQNVTCLQNLAPSLSAEDRQLLPASYGNHGGSWVRKGRRTVDFRWNGFERMRPGTVVWRSWQIDDDNLLFEERIDGNGEVQFESRLFLGAGAWVVKNGDSAGRDELHWLGRDGSSAVMRVTLPTGVSARLEDGVCLPEFGVEQAASVLLLSGRVTLPVRWSASWKCEIASQESAKELSQQCAG